MDIDDREIDESKLCRSDKRDIYSGNEMTKSEQQTFRITCVYLHGNRSTKGLYANACSLDREKLARESRGSKKVHACWNQASLLTHCWLDLSDSIFAFFLFYPTTAIVPRFQNSKKSFVYSCCYRADSLPAAAAVKDIKVLGSIKISSERTLFSARLRE